MNLATLMTYLSQPIVLVGIGGGSGAIARYWLGAWFRAQPWAKEFFWGTLTINVSGSIILGIIAALFKDRASSGFLLLGTGFCGGYTTFSTFSLELVEFFHEGRWDLALIYLAVSFLAGFLGCYLAWSLLATPGR